MATFNSASATIEPVMRKYRAVSNAYSRAHIEGMMACFPLPASTRVEVGREKKGHSTSGLAVAWRTVGDAIGNAMLKVR